jgi:hypothetical protein
MADGLLSAVVQQDGHQFAPAYAPMPSLGVTYKSAWFLAHRVREAMRVGGLAPPMGSGGGMVEIDEVCHGKIELPRTPHPRAKYLRRRQRRSALVPARSGPTSLW